MATFNPLLDLPPFPADGYAPLADRLKTLLKTRNDVIFVQAEAILALEAAATSLAHPGVVALNIVTSPYGGFFGDWLRRAGANVHELKAEAGRPITLAAVEQALAGVPKVDLVALVHAETSSGIVNPLAAIAAAVRAKGPLLVVDAVASVGGHDVAVDALGIDLCVIGPQKALGGPAGLSMASVSPRAWAAMSASPIPSSLSLLDIKTNWLDRGRSTVPGMPAALEFWALEAALTRVETETLVAVTARHERAARATRAGLLGLGLELWIADEAEASMLATAIVIPGGLTSIDLVTAARALSVAITPGYGAISEKIVRIDHTGPRASWSSVVANIIGLGVALQRLGLSADVAAGEASATAVWGEA